MAHDSGLSLWRTGLHEEARGRCLPSIGARFRSDDEACVLHKKHQRNLYLLLYSVTLELLYHRSLKCQIVVDKLLLCFRTSVHHAASATTLVPVLSSSSSSGADVRCQGFENEQLFCACYGDTTCRRCKTTRSRVAVSMAFLWPPIHTSTCPEGLFVIVILSFRRTG